MIVLDTSATTEMIRRMPDGLALIDLAMVNEKKISCTLMRAELASVFRKFTRAGELSPKQAETLFSKSLSLIDCFHPIEDLESEALHESIRLNHSTYDMFYFVLARRTGGTLFTTDRKLMQLCLDNGVNCVTQLDWNE